MTFIQIVTIRTDRLKDVETTLLQWISATAGRRTAERATLTTDRDDPNTYVQIIEFPSYEAAMENSRLPETEQFAERLAELRDAPLIFQNLETCRVDDLAE